VDNCSNEAVDRNRCLSKQEMTAWLCLLTSWLRLPLEEWIPTVFDSKDSKDSKDNLDVRTPASTIPCITYRYQYQTCQMPADTERAKMCSLLESRCPCLLDAARQGSLRLANSKLHPLSQTVEKIIRTTAQDNSPRVASKHSISS
jgi:hypothetical protein